MLEGIKKKKQKQFTFLLPLTLLLVELAAVLNLALINPVAICGIATENWNRSPTSIFAYLYDMDIYSIYTVYSATYGIIFLEKSFF